MTREGLARFADLLRAERRSETEAQRHHRRAGQSYEWGLSGGAAGAVGVSSYEGRGPFQGEIRRLGLPDYWLLCAWCEMTGRGYPSTWPIGARPTFLARLRGGAWPELLVAGGEPIEGHGREARVAAWVSRDPSPLPLRRND